MIDRHLPTTPIFIELFRRYETRLARHGGDPLVAFEIFRSPGLLRGLGAIMMLYDIATFFLVYAVYLQTAVGLTALQAGRAILPFSAGFLVGSTASPRIGRWAGPAAPSLGPVLSAGGAIATAVVSTQSPAGTMPPLPLLGLALLAIGLGIGMSIATMVQVVVERVEPNRAGLVGGIVSSTLQVSSATSIAVLGGLFYNVLGTHTDPATVTRAFAITLLAIATCHIAGAVLAAGPRQRRPVCRRCAA